MGVYIEGLRMPKQGKYITITVYHDGVCKFQFGGELAGKAYEVPEMRGKWIEDGYNEEPFVCSNCGEPCRSFVLEKPRWNYCPWCGAKMEVDG